MALFASTSPSYLILQSLDSCNKYLKEVFPRALRDFVPLVRELKAALRGMGYTLFGDEELKLTIRTKPYGYRGREIAKLLENKNIHVEASDDDFVVFMFTPETGEKGLERLEGAMGAIRKRMPIETLRPDCHRPKRILSVREASFAVSENISAAQSEGRVLAAATVGCPPAVPIVVSGERIDRAAVERFAYYGIDTCTVVK